MYKLKKDHWLVRFSVALTVSVASLMGAQAYAQPTSQSCAADANVCQQTCASIGLYATLRRDAEASKKMEKCNSHCEAEKAKCEGQARGATQSGPVGGPSGGTVPPQAGRRFGDGKCPVEDMQPFEYYNYSREHYVSYKPLDCISVEWRNKAKVTDRRQSGLEARIVNRCPCGIRYRHVGTLRGIDDDDSIMTASSTTSWHSELREDKKFEIIPGSSCHYINELQALYHVETKRCVARKCKSEDRYGNCGYSTTK